MTGSPQGTGRRPTGAAIVIALLLAVLGALLIWEGGRIPDRGGYSGVGPGDVPRLIGWGLMLLAVWTAIDAFRSRQSAPEEIEVGPVLWIIGGLFVQLMLLRTAGFTIASGVLFACAAAAFGKRNFAVTLPLGLVFAFMVYAVFNQLLKLHLPAGPIETLIFGG
ncbi:MAG: tripartite tricarboxylate transporter TctB family protein [Cereibacter sphaeroides]|uniref:Tripartite tricarboxylate transporter TctB family protein n=1 Tax=Cereibacter sphaeroides TaxID=1063 RepID=A0A2W5SAG1_CERSP|nr:MAG: tripartite tricarboxylate transporter TctB family protein [Cereibacter sphaeroides]